MPIYLFTNENETIVHEVVQGMNDVHEYTGPDGKKWSRVYTVPQGATDVKLDPFNQNQFIEKTGKGGGTMGDVWERSAELSQKRAEKRDGVDPVRTKYYEDYAKGHRGKKHPRQIKESLPDIIRI